MGILYFRIALHCERADDIGVSGSTLHVKGEGWNPSQEEVSRAPLTCRRPSAPGRHLRLSPLHHSQWRTAACPYRAQVPATQTRPNPCGFKAHPQVCQ